jgi:hypothetical protein
VNRGLNFAFVKYGNSWHELLEKEIYMISVRLYRSVFYEFEFHSSTFARKESVLVLKVYL